MYFGKQSSDKISLLLQERKYNEMQEWRVKY